MTYIYRIYIHLFGASICFAILNLSFLLLMVSFMLFWLLQNLLLVLFCLPISRMWMCWNLFGDWLVPSNFPVSLYYFFKHAFSLVFVILYYSSYYKALVWRHTPWILQQNQVTNTTKNPTFMAGVMTQKLGVLAILAEYLGLCPSITYWSIPASSFWRYVHLLSCVGRMHTSIVYTYMQAKYIKYNTSKKKKRIPTFMCIFTWKCTKVKTDQLTNLHNA